MKKRKKIKRVEPGLGDLARVVQSGGYTLGDTVWLVDWVGEPPYEKRCTIREAGNPRAGSQEFHLALLHKVERD